MMVQIQSTKADKPLASLSLDLDNEWAYLKTHGDPVWESYPSYLDMVVPRILHALATRKLLITVFVVGQDAALKYNHEALAQIASAGHEIGNHSLRHEPWLHLFSEQDLEQELAEAERHIQAATGQKTDRLSWTRLQSIIDYAARASSAWLRLRCQLIAKFYWSNCTCLLFCYWAI